MLKMQATITFECVSEAELFKHRAVGSVLERREYLMLCRCARGVETNARYE